MRSEDTGDTTTILACPKCGSELAELQSAESWWASVQNNLFPEYEPMMRWSEGRCFPDFDTLQNAYRQAMEGEL